MKKTIRTFPFYLIVLALFLSACAGQPAQAPVQTDALNNPAPTETSAGELMEPAPAATDTDASTVNVPTTGGPVAYQIVPGESQISYQVGETFFNQNNKFATAIGVTTAINGEIQVDPANIQNSSLGIFSVDISQFKSDNGRRDNAIRERFIQTAQYPTVTFAPTQVEGLPASYTPGQEIIFKVTGDLTIRETTLPATFDVTAKLDGDTLTGTATTTFLMSDFGFGPIQMAGILGTEDEVKITFSFIARSG